MRKVQGQPLRSHAILWRNSPLLSGIHRRSKHVCSDFKSPKIVTHEVQAVTMASLSLLGSNNQVRVFGVCACVCVYIYIMYISIEESHDVLGKDACRIYIAHGIGSMHVGNQGEPLVGFWRSQFMSIPNSRPGAATT